MIHNLQAEFGPNVQSTCSPYYTPLITPGHQWPLHTFRFTAVINRKLDGQWPAGDCSDIFTSIEQITIEEAPYVSQNVNATKPLLTRIC